nr:hypothetical protein Iba_chr13eCG10980 [Ipomoea batatas]
MVACFFSTTHLPSQSQPKTVIIQVRTIREWNGQSLDMLARCWNTHTCLHNVKMGARNTEARDLKVRSRELCQTLEGPGDLSFGHHRRLTSQLSLHKKGNAKSSDDELLLHFNGGQFEAVVVDGEIEKKEMKKKKVKMKSMRIGGASKKLRKTIKGRLD